MMKGLTIVLALLLVLSPVYGPPLVLMWIDLKKTK